MKKGEFRRRLCPLMFSLCLLLTGFFGATAAYAFSSANATSYINWNSLNLILDPSMSLTWTSTHSGVSANAQAWNPTIRAYDYRWASDSSSDWGALSADVALVTGSGNASASASTSYSTLSAVADAGSNLRAGYGGSARSWRYGDFVVSGSGIISFSVDYSLSYDLSTNNPYPMDYVIGYSGASLALNNYDTQDRSYDRDYIYERISGLSDVSSLSKTGTLTSVLAFNDGDRGRIYGMSYANAAIPEPSTFLLLGTVLAGFAGLKRKLNA